MGKINFFMAIMLIICFSSKLSAQINIIEGIVSYWKFDGDFYDAHSSNHGTPAGGVSAANQTGAINYCPYFNGNSNAYVTCGNNPNLNITGTAITMSAWIYNEKTTRSDIISKGRDYTSNRGYHLYTTGNPLRIRALFRLAGTTGHGSGNSVDSDPIDLHTWYHVVATFDGIYGRMYINGNLVNVTQQAGSIGSASTQFVIGAHSAGPTGWGYQWKGKIDEVGIWNRVLSETEVNILYNNGQGLQYPFDYQEQANTISNILINQRNDGSGMVDVYFNLHGTGSQYNITLEVSFDGGSIYTPIPASFLSGDVSNISPGINKHIVWDGMGSHPNTYSSSSKLRIIAN